MGVTTTADEAITTAKENIKDAIKALQVALDEETWGSNQYNDDYLHTIEITLIELMVIKRKL